MAKKKANVVASLRWDPKFLARLGRLRDGRIEKMGRLQLPAKQRRKAK